MKIHTNTYKLAVIEQNLHQCLSIANEIRSLQQHLIVQYLPLQQRIYIQNLAQAHRNLQEQILRRSNLF